MKSCKHAPVYHWIRVTACGDLVVRVMHRPYAVAAGHAYPVLTIRCSRCDGEPGNVSE